MNSKFKSLTAALLASLLLLSATACGAQKTDGDSTGTTASADALSETTAGETVSDDPYADRMSVSAELPDGLDYAGASFRSLVNDEVKTGMSDIYVEAETGEVVNDAIYQRKIHVEDLLNVKIEPSTVSAYQNASSVILKCVNAGDDSYDVYLEHMIQAGSDAMQGIFLDWYDVPNMDFSHPWYPQYTVNALTVNGKMYLTLSDIMISSIYNTYCIYYNKTIASAYNLPDLYDIVTSGAWTLDEMETLSKDVYLDLNGDGTADQGDQYGYATSIDSDVVIFFWAFDIPLVNVSSGKVELTANSEKTTNAIAKLRDYFYNSGSAYITDVWTDFIDMFVNGQVLFIPRCIGETVTLFREMDDYGLIPLPKYDEAQTDYNTMLDGCSPVMAVPKTATNLDMIGAVLEAMGEYSYKYVYPA